jgi:MFS family permease
MVIYTPIYLHEYLGFNWSQIGIIFTIMLLPFVLLSFPLGRYSDKIGEKKMLTSGFFIIALFTLVIPLITEPTLWLWAGILFATRVGAATIEVMSESYFFKIVTEENAEAIGFFRNAIPLSYIIAPLVAIPILFFVPSFKYLFFVLGAILLTGFFISLRLKDVK